MSWQTKNLHQSDKLHFIRDSFVANKNSLNLKIAEPRIMAKLNCFCDMAWQYFHLRIKIRNRSCYLDDSVI